MKSLPLLSLLLLTGCVSPSEQFYSSTVTVPPHAGPVQVKYIHDIKSDGRSRNYEGNTVLGTTYYNGRRPPQSEMERQARKVGANMVLYTTEYAGTEQHSFTLTTPNPPQYANSYSSGTVYSGGHDYNYSGTTTTTMSGGYSHQEIPYSVTRYNVFEVYIFNSAPPPPVAELGPSTEFHHKDRFTAKEYEAAAKTWDKEGKHELADLARARAKELRAAPSTSR